MKKTKIITSIGPASCKPDTFEKMVRAGANVARINFSHATDEEKENVIETVKEVRKRTGLAIGLLFDTKGPEFRNGMLENDEINLIEGNTIRIVKEDVLGNEERFSVNYKEAIDSLEVGNKILLENGLMKIEVISKEQDGVTCKIINGGVLGNKKSLNVPGVHLNIPFISEEDKEDIIYACTHDGDFLALSFVSTKEDVLAAKEIIKEHNSDIKIISKIESTTGVKNLEAIIEASDGIMVARGDLGVEVPMQELPIVQKAIIKACRKYGKICIVATEMLESMKKNVRPTRAEISDIANAVLDGTDAVMLSGETTTGKHPIEAVRFMAETCESTERAIDYKNPIIPINKDNIASTIAHSVVESANLLDVKVIIASTLTGYTARKISALRPKSLILATCPDEKAMRSLALNFGVYTSYVPKYDSTDTIIEVSIEKAKEYLALKEKDIVVVTGGLPNGNKRSTNFLKIEEI